MDSNNVITNSVYDEILIHFNHLDSSSAESKTLDLLDLLVRKDVDF
jgi:hypothetical protein